MSEIDAVHFEAVKIAITQNSDGTVLRLGIHPEDCPSILFQDWAGSRYMVAMVKLDDHDQPVAMTDKREIEKLKSSAGALCRNRKFQEWILSGTGEEVTEANAVAFLRASLGIKSRSEFDTDPNARRAFNDMREEFQEWLRASSRQSVERK